MGSLRNFSDNGQPKDESKALRPSEQIQVELDTTNLQEPKLKLRQQSWAEGMGWFTQKTITLDAEQAVTLTYDLEQALISAKLAASQAHHSPSTNKTSAPVRPETPSKASIIEFPTDRTAHKASEIPAADGEAKILTFKPRKRA